MPIAWHPKRWWNFWMSEGKKRGKKIFFFKEGMKHIATGT